MKFKQILSKNFTKKPRNPTKIRFIVIHYTGMQSKRVSIKRLLSKKHKVSCHYLIDQKGEVTQMVLDKFPAWHAGKSKWKNFKNLNKNSIGIELHNKGHEFGYQNFSNSQIISLINLCKNLKKKYKISIENFLGHSDIAPLRKLDPGEKFPWKKLSNYKLGCWHRNNKKKTKFTKSKEVENLFFKNLFKIGYRYFKINSREVKNDTRIIKSFQQRYTPKKISGKIDKKTFKISHFLANKSKLT